MTKYVCRFCGKELHMTAVRVPAAARKRAYTVTTFKDNEGSSECTLSSGSVTLHDPVRSDDETS